MRATSLDAVLPALQKLQSSPVPAAHWALVHCAQSLEYALSGYPVMRSWLFRSTLARMGRAVFLRRGYSAHPLDQAIPGAPEIARDGDSAQAAARLLAAIAAFQAHQGELHPHFAYGAVSKDLAGRLHAMHIAEHLGELGF